LRPDTGGDSLRCPADDSIFGAEDGAVLQGPATTPIPWFEARPGVTGVEVRSPGAAG
jgi:nitrite reductase/ring-hydroxylating ferredoxin subunit